MPSSLPEAVIFDLDGTLADCEHRRGLLPNWDAFYEAMDADPIIAPVQRLLHVLSDRLKIIVCSGRPDKYRARVEAWMRKHGLHYDELHLRPTSRLYEKDYIIKQDMLVDIRTRYTVVFTVDDRQQVVDMWRRNGLVCLQAAPGDWETRPKPLRTPELTLMVGPSGAGKTHWIGEVRDEVLSSDRFRHVLLGDFKRQDKNEHVFRALHHVARARLEAGLPTIIDATHIRRKDRVTAAKLLPEGGRLYYVIVNRPMEEKIATRGWRPVELLEKHEQVFQANLKDILAGDGTGATIIDTRGGRKPREYE